MTDVSGSNELVIRRLFDAPPELVFACWADATHLARWGGAPEGFTVTIERQDIRVGGGFKIGMRSPDGNTFWLQGRYREITEPVRIAFTHAWLGEDGHPAPETLVTIELRPHGKEPSSPSGKPACHRRLRAMGTGKAGTARWTGWRTIWRGCAREDET